MPRRVVSAPINSRVQVRIWIIWIICLDLNTFYMVSNGNYSGHEMHDIDYLLN